MLSKKAKYALKALFALAQDNVNGQKSMLIAEIARQERIPKKFLEAILLDLKNDGILYSKRGKTGGYALRKTPDQISVGQVIRVIDGPLALIPCASQSAYVPCEECVDVETCAIRLTMRKVRDATASILDSTTLADALKSRRHSVDWVI
ncbi:MAG: Rrf2 family transcriptional regulator [uncultured Cytophagales bacterium]|uniref:Rrf2 family transcriptional regulator n=1 Tax=uncultured Cytophagales bacterium TaxID=158755 RepID=A0A6J4L589_9SPHI|nr:MAG: Rrf2 family transcriptional regulator [uncultured Cytophagales bacterium]